MGRVLVTGASGYIGSHVVVELLNSDYSVFALGNASGTPLPVPPTLSQFQVIPDSRDLSSLPPSLQNARQLTANKGDLKFGRCNLLLRDRIDELFQQESFDSVIHLASLKGVADSVANPLEFYMANLRSTLNLLTVCKEHGVSDLIFASSATVYGVPEEIPIREDSMVGRDITNPYGYSKWMIETMIKDMCNAAARGGASEDGLRAIILRIFDPAGGHPSGLLGESGPPKHLMPFISHVALGKYPHLSIYGNHFPTADGTGERDFVHIMDVARAHVLALERLKELKEEGVRGRAEVYNLGLGKGHTVLEMVEEFEKASGLKVGANDWIATGSTGELLRGIKIPVKLCAPRVGDVASIYCDPTAAREQLKWTPEYGIREICRDIWKFCQSQRTTNHQ